MPGVIDEEIYTCSRAEIGREIGLSGEMIRLIERDAIEKCRTFCRENGYRLVDLLPGDPVEASIPEA